MDVPTLMTINRQVVALTKEPHRYSEADGKKLVALLDEVSSRAENQDFDESVYEKASLLVFGVASGQHFGAGNKRTALVAGLVFLRKNGYEISLDDPSFVAVVDKVGIAASNLDDLYGVMRRLIMKAPTERKGWEGAAAAAVESNRAFLTAVAS